MTPAFPAPPTCLMSNSNKKLAVIGLGNPLRKDDGIGLVVFDRLKTSFKHPDIEYLDYGTGSFDILFKINDYKNILILDAVNAGMEAGDHKIFPITNIESEIKSDLGSTHGFGLKELKKLCFSMGMGTNIIVAGIEAADVSLGRGISKELQGKFDNAIDNISLYIRKYLLS